jgi:hypothetical protein
MSGPIFCTSLYQWVGICKIFRFFKFHTFIKTCKKLLHEKYVKKLVYIPWASSTREIIQRSFEIRKNCHLEFYFNFNRNNGPVGFISLEPIFAYIYWGVTSEFVMVMCNQIYVI